MNFFKLFSKKQKDRIRKRGYNFAAAILLSKKMTIEELTNIVNINEDFDFSDDFDLGIQDAMDDYILLKNNFTDNDKLEGLIISWEKELIILRKESIYPEFHDIEILIDDLKKIIDTKEI